MFESQVPDRQVSSSVVVRGLEYLSAQKEKYHAQNEAENLAKILLRIPRHGDSVLHEVKTALDDGRQVHVSLCNTVNATDVKSLIAAQHRADRVDVSITGAEGNQHDYSISFHFLKEHDFEYYEYSSDGSKVECVLSTSPEMAYVANNQVPFSLSMQTRVYRQTADILHAVKSALTNQPQSLTP